MSEQERMEQLDAWLDQLLAGELLASAASESEKQLARAWSELSAQETPRLSNVARAREWNRLHARLRAATPTRERNWFAWWLRVPRWAQMAAIALVVVLILNGINSVAASSLPGSILYPVKRLGESGELLARLSPAERARLQMDFANRRLDEVQALLQRGERVDPAIFDAIDESIVAALSEVINTRGVERAQLLQALAQLTLRQEEILRALAANASPAERERLLSSAQFLRGIADFAISAKASGDASPIELPTRAPTIPPSRTPMPSPTATPTHFVSGTPEAPRVPSDTLIAAPASATPRAEQQNSSSAARASTTATRAPTNQSVSNTTPNPSRTPFPSPTLGGGTAKTIVPPSPPLPNETRPPTHANVPNPTRRPDETREPPLTRRPDETREPPPTREPNGTRLPPETRPPRTHEPPPTHEPPETPRPTREPTQPRPTRTPRP